MARRGRALTIVRTELGRAYSVAGQQRFDQAHEVLPGLQKQWRRSGKIHSRASHDRADGQVRDVDKPFDVAGVQLRFPRDPLAPAQETINCGCTSLLFMASWEVVTPGRLPFTPADPSDDAGDGGGNSKGVSPASRTTDPKKPHPRLIHPH